MPRRLRLQVVRSIRRRRLQRSRELLRVRRRGRPGPRVLRGRLGLERDLARTNPAAQQSCPVTCELDTLNCPRHIEQELTGSVGAFVQFDEVEVSGYGYIDDLDEFYGCSYRFHFYLSGDDECTAPSTSFATQFSAHL